jgi:hypothetical protein
MRAKPLLWTLALLALLAIVSVVSIVSGFLAGINYSSTLKAQADAGITTGTLSGIRAGNTEVAIRMLETSLQADLLSHWGGFPFEDSVPRVWVLRPLNLGGLAAAAAYLTDHPNPTRHEFVNAIVACYMQPGLPDPRTEMAAHRKAIGACYDKLR